MHRTSPRVSTRPTWRLRRVSRGTSTPRSGDDPPDTRARPHRSRPLSCPQSITGKMWDMRTAYAALLAGLCLTLTVSGCSGDDADPQTVDVVLGGGGEGDRIDGLVSDLDVNGDLMALVGHSREGDPVLWRSE